MKRMIAQTSTICAARFITNGFIFISICVNPVHLRLNFFRIRSRFGSILPSVGTIRAPAAFPAWQFLHGGLKTSHGRKSQRSIHPGCICYGYTAGCICPANTTCRSITLFGQKLHPRPMKTSITLISLLLASLSFAQSSFERDLAKLTED